MTPERHRVPLVAALALALALAGCSDSPTVVRFETPVELHRPWIPASPEEVEMDRARLEEALARAAALPRLRTLVVVRRGRLVVDRAFGGARSDALSDVRSVTKSVVSTLVGLAAERGQVAGLDQPLGELLGPGVAALDGVERAVTLRHLLTMGGGWAWTESGAVGYNEWVTSSDPVAYLLERPHASPPGTDFAYNSAAVHLLGVALQEAVGEALPDYAARVLFGPLGIEMSGWETLGPGRVNGGSGLSLRPLDLARLGQLFLQDGWSGSRRVLPEGWVAESTRAHWNWRTDLGPTEASYGYLWWTDELNRAWFAWGYGGQFIYVAPERELVVVTATAWWSVDGQPAPADLATRVLDLIVGGILPSAPPH